MYLSRGQRGLSPLIHILLYKDTKRRNRNIYYSSIGKFLPCFAALGKESHIGSAFNALAPNLLIAEVTQRMSLNTDLCDVAQAR